MGRPSMVPGQTIASNGICRPKWAIAACPWGARGVTGPKLRLRVHGSVGENFNRFAPRRHLSPSRNHTNDPRSGPKSSTTSATGRVAVLARFPGLTGDWLDVGHRRDLSFAG
jgi:hypothetical protein